MKLTKLMVAIVALGAGSSAFAAINAARITNFSGASATKGNVAAGLNSLCSDAGGTMKEWGASTGNSNISSYVCVKATSAAMTSGTGAAGTYGNTADSEFLNFAGTSYGQVNLNVGGGSFTAFQTLGGFQDLYINLAGCAATAGSTGPIAGNPAAAQVCGSTGAAAGKGGFMDVAPDCFPDTVRNTVSPTAFVITPQGFAQAFGVAVSDALYKAMYVKQRAAGLIPAVCPAANGAIEVDNATTTQAHCVPSISKADMAAVMSNNEFAAPKTQGASFFGAPAGTELRYIRRVDTSGTQATAQNYFLGLTGLAVEPLGIIPDPNDTINIVPPATSGPGAIDDEAGGLKDQAYDPLFTGATTYRVVATPGTGDVRNELNKATILSGATNYAIGWLSGENDQRVGATPWRWVRVSETPMAENANTGQAAFPNTNRTNLQNGRYDGFFEGVAVHPASETAFWTALIGKLTTGPVLKGLVPVDGVAMPYNRNGSCKTPSAHN